MKLISPSKAVRLRGRLKKLLAIDKLELNITTIDAYTDFKIWEGALEFQVTFMLDHSHSQNLVLIDS